MGMIIVDNSTFRSGGGPLMGRIGTTRAERDAMGLVPPVRARLSALTAGLTAIVRLDEGAAAKHAPYNRLTITNNADEDLLVTLNGQYTFSVLSKQSRAVDEIWFHWFQIKNESATASSDNEIEYIAEKVPTSVDSALRKVVKGMV